MADPEQKTAETRTIHLMFLGRYRTAKSKGWSWYQIDPDANDGDPLKKEESKLHHYTGKNLLLSAQPGVIITIEQRVEGGAVLPSTAKAVGAWQNEADRILWQTQNRAVERDIESEGKAAKEMRRNLPKEALAPFRKAYQSARNAKEQAQILAFVFQEITRWRGTDV